jgi:S1-C subfamily serine protease
MVLTPSGEVLTNNHVIQGATDIRALVDGGRRSYTAKVLGYDVADDVALLQLQGASGLPTVRTGGSQAVRVGDAVVAVGYAGGQPGAPTVTDGSVTALGRTLTAADPGGRAETLSGMIQIDAQIEPGDSGGPLLDGDGKVIGINTAAAAGYRMAASDVGFAVPIDTAMTIVRQVEAGKGSAKVHVGPRGILGVEVQPADRVPGRLGRGFPGGASTPTGAVVVGVASGGPADRGGLEPGDTIVSIDGTSIATADDLTAALGSHHPGDKVAVGWTDQSGAHHTAALTLIGGPPD